MRRKKLGSSLLCNSQSNMNMNNVNSSRHAQQALGKSKNKTSRGENSTAINYTNSKTLSTPINGLNNNRSNSNNKNKKTNYSIESHKKDINKKEISFVKTVKIHDKQIRKLKKSLKEEQFSGNVSYNTFRKKNLLRDDSKKTSGTRSKGENSTEHSRPKKKLQSAMTNKTGVIMINNNYINNADCENESKEDQKKDLKEFTYQYNSNMSKYSPDKKDRLELDLDYQKQCNTTRAK